MLNEAYDGEAIPKSVSANRDQHLEEACRTFEIESEAILGLSKRLDDNFVNAVSIFNDVTSHVVVTGMGKSGIVGKKVAATLASTGTPSFFLHPGEASHGDLGMLTKKDVVLAISGSGETDEVLRLIPIIQRLSIPLVSIVGNVDSTLARESQCVLDASVEREACPLKLAPTASTTAALAMGDALAVSLMRLKKFSPKDFAFRHPGGSLGRKLLTRVKDVMATDSLPIVRPDTYIKDVISTITKGMKGLAVVEDDGKVVGVVTDGDVCRAFELFDGRFNETKAKQIMTKSPKMVPENVMIVDAEKVMHEHGIVTLLVEFAEGSNVLSGIVQRHTI